MSERRSEPLRLSSHIRFVDTKSGENDVNLSGMEGAGSTPSPAPATPELEPLSARRHLKKFVTSLRVEEHDPVDTEAQIFLLRAEYLEDYSIRYYITHPCYMFYPHFY